MGFAFYARLFFPDFDSFYILFLLGFSEILWRGESIPLVLSAFLRRELKIEKTRSEGIPSDASAEQI